MTCPVIASFRDVSCPLSRLLRAWCWACSSSSIRRWESYTCLACPKATCCFCNQLIQKHIEMLKCWFWGENYNVLTKSKIVSWNFELFIWDMKEITSRRVVMRSPLPQSNPWRILGVFQDPKILLVGWRVEADGKGGECPAKGFFWRSVHFEGS